MKNINNIINTGLITTALWLSISGQPAAQQAGSIEQAFAFDSSTNQEARDIRLGDFIFHPTITFSQSYDDNIYASSSAPEDDNISALNAELSLISDWPQHLLGFKLGADANRYASFDAENTVDNWIDFRGRYDMAKHWSAAMTASHINDHEDRASADAIFGLQPTEYTENRMTLSVDGKLRQHKLKIAATTARLNYHDVNSETGVINNDGRDRTDNSIGIRFNYALGKKYYVFIQSSLENRDYQQAVDDNLFNRDSDIRNHVLGLTFRPDTHFSGEVFAGRLRQQFEDPRFMRVSEADFGAHMIWRPSASSQLSFSADRSIEETTLNNASGLLYDSYQVSLRQAFYENWSWYLNAAQASADYQMIPRQDDYIDYATGLNYQLEKGLSFGMDIVHSQRDSTEDIDDFRRNNIFLRVTAQL